MLEKDEQGNEIISRSRIKTRKPFYKKSWFWTIIFLGLIFGIIGMYILNGEGELEVQPIKENPEENLEVVNPELEVTNPEEAIEEPLYTYEDFLGTYVAFKGEPYNSPVDSMSAHIMVLGGNYYQTLNRWDYDMTSTIIDKKIDGNILTIDLDSDKNEEWGLHSNSGTEQFELHYDGDKKILRSVTTGSNLYSMSSQDLQTHYSQSEIDYSRIIMTVNGKPSLDTWVILETEMSGVPVIRVSHNSSGEPTEASDQVPYPENVTHLDLTDRMMAYGVITYSSHGNGYITRYPMPLHYHQEDQSEEGYRQLAQESLDSAYVIYVEPFEPYTVADFIGRVEFLY